MNDNALPKEVRVKTANILAVAALKDDVILLLHQDRKDHILMNYAFEIDRQSPEEQLAIALLVVKKNHSPWRFFLQFIILVVCESLRKFEFFRMVDVYFRMDVQQPTNQQHSCDDKSLRAFFTV